MTGSAGARALAGRARAGEGRAQLHTITAGLPEKASLERPDTIRPVSRPIEYVKDLPVELEPYMVAVLEI